MRTPEGPSFIQTATSILSSTTTTSGHSRLRHLSGAPGASNLTAPSYHGSHLGGGAAGQKRRVPEDDVTDFLSFYHGGMDLLVAFSLYLSIAPGIDADPGSAWPVCHSWSSGVLLRDPGPVTAIGLACFWLFCLNKLKGALKDDGVLLCSPPGCGSSNWTGRTGNGLKAFRMFPDARHTQRYIKAPDHHLHITHSLWHF